MNVYYIGYNQDMAIEYVEACAMWARSFNYVASEIEEGMWEEDKDDKHIKTYTIRFPGSSHRIVALSSRPANLRGKQGVVVLDEAAFHDKLDELLKAALALLIWGGKVRVISTHNGEDNPFNELIKDIRAGKRKGTVHRIDFQEAINQGLYRRVCLRLGRQWNEAEQTAWSNDVYAFYGEAALEELDVIPSQGSGTFLPRAMIERCMKRDIPVIRWRCDNNFVMLPDQIRQAEARDFCEEQLLPLLSDLDPQRINFFGMDFGRSGDLSVLWPLTQQQNLRYRSPFVLEMSNVPFEEQRAILFYVLDRLPRLAGGKMDARGNGQYLAERTMQKYGSRIDPVMLTEPWYREEMPRLKAFFEDDTWEIPADADHVSDFRAFKMVRGVARLPDLRVKGTSGTQRHGDAGIAGVLAVAATRMEVQEYAYHGIKKDQLQDMDRPIRTTAGFGRQKGLW
jgi:phage FluMu gp28-like protein